MTVLPEEIPEDLPGSAPGVVVVLLQDGGVLYRRYDNTEEARESWREEMDLKPGERAYLFQGGVLLAFMSRL